MKTYPRWIGLSFLIVILVSVLLATLLFPPDFASDAPVLAVVGDIQIAFQMGDLHPDHWDVQNLVWDERSIHGLSLQQVLSRAKPHSSRFEVVLVGDGRELKVIDSTKLADHWITHESGWEILHRESAQWEKTPGLEAIVVVTQSAFPRVGIATLSGEANHRRTTVGQLHRERLASGVAGSQPITPLEGGPSPERLVDEDRFLLEDSYSPVLVVGNRGHWQEWDPAGQLLLEDQSLAYWMDDQLVVPDVRGFIYDPPERRNTDIFHLARHYLTAGEPVMIILVDGLGWHQYQWAAARNRTPYLRSLPAPEPALAVFPSITPVNFAAALTGELPYKNGVVVRNTRIPHVPTIFGWSEAEGLSSAIVMGPIQPIQFEISPILTTWNPGATTWDGAILLQALNTLNEGHDLVMVHFKDVDRVGHQYGELAPATLDQIEATDGKLQQLVQAWSGVTIIFSDHGMFSIYGAGEHGLMVYQDMFVPHWIIYGGDANEIQ